MAKEFVKDFLSDDDGDLIIENGDFKIGESDYQHIRDILQAAPGHYKQFPLVGANIMSMVNGSIDGDFRKELRKQLQADGYNVKSIKMVNGDLEIDAERL